MTVSTTANSVVYRGNGAATSFAVPFKVLDEDQLVVRRRVYATGEYEHTYAGTAYSYSGIGDSSGTLTLSGTALDDDYELVIERVVPYTQDLDIVNSGGFYPDTVEEQLDLIVMMVQRLATIVGRSITFPVGETGDSVGPAADRAGKILGFDALGALTVSGGSAFPEFMGPAGTMEVNGLSFTTPQQFGAAADGVTDDSDAFIDAIASLPATGGTIHIPHGRYLIGQRIVVNKPVHFIGQGLGRNAGIVGGTTYAFPNFINGTTLVFSAGVAGFYFQTSTTETDRTIMAALPEDGTKYTQQGAQYSRIQDLSILSLGGGTTGVNGTHGVKSHTQIVMQRVLIRNFGGDGVHLNGSMSATGHYAESQWGNVSHTILIDVFCENNGGNGLFVDGRDANACSFIGVNCASNELWGINDQSLLGNGYYGCHMNGNEAGAARVANASAASEFWSCYIESAATGTSGVANMCDLQASCMVMGGIMADRANHEDDAPYRIESGRTAFGAPPRATNRAGAKEVSFTMGERSTAMVAFTFGSADDPGNTGANNAFAMRFGYQTANWWGLGYAGSSANVFIEFPNSIAAPRAMAPSFRNGLFLGGGGSGPRLFHGTAAPATGTWARGDRVLNSEPAVGEPSGWTCVVAGTPGTWAASANLV